MEPKKRFPWVADTTTQLTNRPFQATLESIPGLLNCLQIQAQVVLDCTVQFFDYMAEQIMFRHVHLAFNCIRRQFL
jgi:hypothetical protein